MTKSPNSHPPINFAIEPKMYADSSISTGFTKYAEKVNGRFVTIGFVSLLATEILTGHSFIGLLKDILGWGIFWELVQTQIKKPGCCEKCCLQRHKLTQ